MKVVETSAFRMEAIKMGRFQERMAVTTQVSVTLVVGKYQNDVGAVC
tara:strand:+ start:3662 stop:3802 length:141 start_codon:yes stop_codon:yes gene_type:complete